MSDRRSEKQIDRDARKGNEDTRVKYLARQLMQQQGYLLWSDAVRDARGLVARGIKELF